MRRLSFLLSICLTIIALPGRDANASPIELLFTQYNYPQVPGVSNRVFALTDFSNGGSITLGSGSLGQFDPNHNYPNPAPIYPMNDGFGIVVGVADGQGGFLGPGIALVGTTTGSYHGPDGMPPRLGGGFNGTGTQADLLLGGSVDDLHPLLLDWLNHPEHVHIQGVIGGGSLNNLVTTLTFDPPSVPEPATWAAWSLVGLGALAARRWRLKRACN